MRWWEVDEVFRTSLDVAGLGSFESLMENPVGELLDSNENNRQLRRIRIQDGAQPKLLFLKRIGREPVGTLLRMLFFGRKPCSGPLREKMMIDALGKAGLPVMRALAWGEERRFGLPVRGFLLVEGVRGTDLAQLVDIGNATQRLGLLRDFGSFVGRLHHEGFFQPVRLKDVFCEVSADTWSFVLIDRESSKPWTSRFSNRRCVNSLARAFRRTIRDGHRFSRHEILVFTRHYLRTIGENRFASGRLFRQEVSQVLRKEFKSFIGR